VGSQAEAESIRGTWSPKERVEGTPFLCHGSPSPRPLPHRNDAIGRHVPPHPNPLPWGEGALSAGWGCRYLLVNATVAERRSQSGVAAARCRRTPKNQLNRYGPGEGGPFGRLLPYRLVTQVRHGANGLNAAQFAVPVWSSGRNCSPEHPTENR